jgi:hypothetical protein
MRERRSSTVGVKGKGIRRRGEKVRVADKEIQRAEGLRRNRKQSKESEARKVRQR